MAPGVVDRGRCEPMRPNPTTDELQDANRDAQRRDAEAVAKTDVSHDEVRDAIKEIDRIDGVKMAFGEPETVKVHARVDGDDAIDRIEEAGYVIVDTGRDSDGIRYAMVGLSPDPSDLYDHDKCPNCGDPVAFRVDDDNSQYRMGFKREHKKCGICGFRIVNDTRSGYEILNDGE